MNVIVIGGGASGLMAAITAAKGGHSVTLLERQARVGRKLLSTGNGRCNLTNLNMGLPYYHGQDAAFIRPAFEALSLDATLDFFHGLGLLTTAEDNGRVYPYSDQAGSVVDVLRFAADAAVELDTGLRQCHLGTAADAAADQGIHALLHQEARQRAVAAAVGVHHFLPDDLAVRHFIDLELLRVAEVLENLTVFIGNCNFHNGISFASFA